MAAATAAVLAVIASTASQATAAHRPRGPSAAQIRRAVAGASRSRSLWATVNICAPSGGHRQGGLIGVRGEMGSLGFSATLSMTVRLNHYSTARRRFIPVPGSTAHKTVTLGAFSSQVHQGGAEFPFAADPGRLDASVTFTWTRGTKRIGEVTRTTSGGHPQAAFGRPKHHSSATCSL